MSASLVRLALCGALGVCGELVHRPRPVEPEPAEALQSPCAQLAFQLTGRAASFSYPSHPCAFGAASIRFDRMTWNEPKRILTVAVRAVNPGRQAAPLPVRLELPANGRVVLAPPGTAADSIAPLDMDSTLATGRALWLIGGTGSLAPGDSSAARDLTFSIRWPVTRGRLRFVGTGEVLLRSPGATPGGGAR